jgi:hypothetical protein
MLIEYTVTIYISGGIFVSLDFPVERKTSLHSDWWCRPFSSAQPCSVPSLKVSSVLAAFACPTFIVQLYLIYICRKKHPFVFWNSLLCVISKTSRFLCGTLVLGDAVWFSCCFHVVTRIMTVENSTKIVLIYYCLHIKYGLIIALNLKRLAKTRLQQYMLVTNLRVSYHVVETYGPHASFDSV